LALIIALFNLINMVEPVAQTNTPQISEEELERQTARKYQQLQQETQALIARLMEVEDEKKENE